MEEGLLFHQHRNRLYRHVSKRSVRLTMAVLPIAHPASRGCPPEPLLQLLLVEGIQLRDPHTLELIPAPPVELLGVRICVDYRPILRSDQENNRPALLKKTPVECLMLPTLHLDPPTLGAIIKKAPEKSEGEGIEDQLV